jgi:hypothetical protein
VIGTQPLLPLPHLFLDYSWVQFVPSLHAQLFRLRFVSNPLVYSVDSKGGHYESSSSLGFMLLNPTAAAAQNICLLHLIVDVFLARVQLLHVPRLGRAGIWCGWAQ